MWEYLVIHTFQIDIGDRVKHQKSKELDPGISDWLAVTRKFDNKDMARVAWLAQPGYYTTVSRMLNTLGKENWELVSVTIADTSGLGWELPVFYFKRTSS